ncbi:MAG: cytidine deaminase, partial [Altererythrobacter sp.]|nr:cytidine deaminase [Altererythrobacter sp.]
MSEDNNRDSLIAAAKRALENSYSPYSKFRVGAALRFADGTIVTGTNIENASYGLTLCAETVAIAKAMDDGHRGGLEEIAVIGDTDAPVTPCGRCRQ